jgi:hypothetical protein
MPDLIFIAFERKPDRTGVSFAMVIMGPRLCRQRLEDGIECAIDVLSQSASRRRCAASYLTASVRAETCPGVSVAFANAARFFCGISGLDLGSRLRQLVSLSHLTLCLSIAGRGTGNDFRKFLKQFDRPDGFGDIGVHA